MPVVAQIIVLVGPKGAGKTTIGKLLAREPDVRFLEVESIAKRVLAEMGNQIDESYARRAFDEFVRGVESIDRAHRVIVLETTGASDETPRFLDDLRRNHRVRLVRVRASAGTCARRIVERDQSRQIAVSPALVSEMHARSEALQLPWDLEVTNDPPLSVAEVELVFAPLLADVQ